MNFEVSSRGWCYLLEQYGLPKGDFKLAQSMMTDLRKTGQLPIDICAEDMARQWQELEQLDCYDPDNEARRIHTSIDNWIDGWTPFSFWWDKPVYLLCMVEKIDLVSLFRDVCRKYHVPICNARGWSNLHSRGRFCQMVKEECRDKRVVLLYFGDFDPVGLNISNTLPRTLSIFTKPTSAAKRRCRSRGVSSSSIVSACPSS